MIRPPLQAEERPASPSVGASDRDRLWVRKAWGWVMVRLDEIDWVSGAGNYVCLHVGARTHLHRSTMGDFAQRLGDGFVRIHRSTIINSRRVSLVRRLSSGQFEVTLSSGHRVCMARRLGARVSATVSGVRSGSESPALGSGEA